MVADVPSGLSITPRQEEEEEELHIKVTLKCGLKYLDR
jgi:hypothetical protein